MEIFNGPNVDKKKFVQLSFKEYCLGPDKVGGEGGREGGREGRREGRKDRGPGTIII
jgi:hypothetical protein